MRPRVLLIEDDPDDRALAERELLPLRDVELVVAADPASLDQALNEPVAVIVTDSQLTWTDGFTVLDRVRERWPAAAAVLFSLGGDEELALSALRRGFDDFVAKSMPHRLRLQATVSALVRRHQERFARLAAESRLQDSEQRFRTLIESSTDVVAVIDAQGIIRYVTPSVRRIFGFDPSQVLGHHILDFAHPDHAEQLMRVFEQIKGAPGNTALEQLRIFDGNNETRLIEVTFRNLLHDPAVGGIVANTRDITDRYALQEQLSQAQKMEAVGRLAGGIAHDFNNLLTAISGHAQLLLEQVPAGSPLQADASEISKAAARATALTRQLLAFSRRQVLQPRVLDLHAIVGDMENMLRRLIGEHVHLRIAMSAKRHNIVADAGQIEQVVLNLAVNARDAMPGGGELTISTQNTVYREQTGTLPAGEYIVLEVSDTGSGISPEALPHIFEPFFTTKELGRGTGLGLSTVHGVVTQSGGAIEVSTGEKGTAFYVFLPTTNKPAETAVTEPIELPITNQTQTILVVEDEAAVRALTRKVLERSGYKVYVAEDGYEALEISRELDGPIDLIVTDVVMPGINGRELVNRLLPERPDTKILYMSGYSEDAITDHGVLHPGAAFLEKPFTPDVLARKVREVLAGSAVPA